MPPPPTHHPKASAYSSKSVTSPNDKQQVNRDERIAKLKVELREHIRSLNLYEPIKSDSWWSIADSLVQIYTIASMSLQVAMNGHSVQTSGGSSPSSPNTANQPLTSAMLRGAPAATPPPSTVQSASRSGSNPMLGKKQHGTLWDQQYDEIPIRILMEEGKLNLLLRLLTQYKQLQINEPDRYLTLCKERSHTFKYPAEKMMMKLLWVECSIAQLIVYSVKHIEAVQIVDLPTYLSLCRDVLQYTVKHSRFAGAVGSIYGDVTTKHTTVVDGSAVDASTTTQPLLMSISERLTETAVIYFLHAMLVKIDDMDETLILNLMSEYSLFPLLCQHLQLHYQWHSASTLSVAALALNAFIGSDGYGAEKNRWLATDDEKRSFVALKGLFVDALINTAPVSAAAPYAQTLRRRDVLKLVDELARYERTMGIKSAAVPLKLNCINIPPMVPASSTRKPTDSHSVDQITKSTDSIKLSSDQTAAVQGRPNNLINSVNNKHKAVDDNPLANAVRTG